MCRQAPAGARLRGASAVEDDGDRKHGGGPVRCYSLTPPRLLARRRPRAPGARVTGGYGESLRRLLTALSAREPVMEIGDNDKRRVSAAFEGLCEALCGALEALEAELPSTAPLGAVPRGRFQRTPWRRADSLHCDDVHGPVGTTRPRSTRSFRQTKGADLGCAGRQRKCLAASRFHPV